jgi:hypothetical protein
MRELIGAKGTIGHNAAVPKKAQKSGYVTDKLRMREVKKVN